MISKEVQQVKMTIHKESHEDNVLCKFCCDQETLKKHYYKNHSHCMTCNKTFENIEGILYHLLLRHGLRYQCKYCSFSDFDENELDSHMKNCLNNDEIQDVDKKTSFETFENDLILTNDTDVDEKKERLSSKNEIHDQTQVKIVSVAKDCFEINVEENMDDLEGEPETVVKNSKIISKPAVESDIKDVDKKTSYETFEKDLILTNDTDVDEEKVRLSKELIDSTNLEERLSQKNEIHDQTQVNIVNVTKDSFDINVEENMNNSEDELETVIKNSKMNSKPEVESDSNTACLVQNCFDINVEENMNDLEGEPEIVVENSKMSSKPEVESDSNTACLVQHSEMYSFDASPMYSTIQHDVKVEDISENETSLDIENTSIIKALEPLPLPLSILENYTENSNKDQTEEIGNASLTYSKPKEIKFNCEICGKGFLRDRDLKNHHSAIHLKVKPYKCEVADCGKYFAIESSKIRHFNIVHDKIKPYRCSTCEIDFSTNVRIMPF